MGAFSAAAVAATRGVRHATDTTFLLLLLFHHLPNICAPSPQGDRLALADSLGCAGPATTSLMSAMRVHLTSLGDSSGR